MNRNTNEQMAEGAEPLGGGGGGPERLEARMTRQRLRVAPEALRERVMAMAMTREPVGEGRSKPSWWEAFWGRIPVGACVAMLLSGFVWMSEGVDRWLNGGVAEGVTVAISRDLIRESQAERHDLMRFETLAWMGWWGATSEPVEGNAEPTRKLNLRSPYDTRRILLLA